MRLHIAMLRDVYLYIRAKNAGPFWITLDLFFDGEDSYARFRDAPALSPEAVAKIYGVDPRTIAAIRGLAAGAQDLLSPRGPPGRGPEGDMHGGQHSCGCSTWSWKLWAKVASLARLRVPNGTRSSRKGCPIRVQAV